jgi:fructoselysine-6-phosphate deglycase
MFNFDEARFESIQSGAVGLASRIHAIVGDALAAGVEKVVFLGTGGAAILMQPAVLLLNRQSTLPAILEISAEVVLSGSPWIGPKALVVIPSLSGTTKESVAALDYCLTRGAHVLTLVGHADTPLGRVPNALVNFAEDDTSSESFYVQSLLIALAAMAHRGEFSRWEETVAELGALPRGLIAAKTAFEPRAQSVAGFIAASPWHIITGAGPAWPQAFYYGMCILEEMQWIRTRPVHASDFFHGTLELVDGDARVIILKGEDSTRPLAERVENFARQVAGGVEVIDTKDLPLPGISDETRALLVPALLATVLERVSAHLEELRNHPLTTRRYYKRIAY